MHALLLKCRDRDGRVQLSAYEALAATKRSALQDSMRPAQWRDVIEGGLGLHYAAQKLRSKSASAPQCMMQLTRLQTVHSAGPRTLAADRSVYALWPLAAGCHTIEIK